MALGIIFGYVYLLFTTFPEVFGSVYGWSEGLIGLSYLGCGIGFMVGAGIVGKTNDSIVLRLTKKNGGVRKPEYRMSVMMWFTPLIAIGMFWYGWSAKAATHWIVPILGTVPIGIGMMGFFLPSFIYVIEAFGFYSASAIASLYVRCLTPLTQGRSFDPCSALSFLLQDLPCIKISDLDGVILFSDLFRSS